MRPEESLHVEEPTALAGPHPLNVVCTDSLVIHKTLFSSASGAVLCNAHISKGALAHPREIYFSCLFAEVQNLNSRKYPTCKFPLTNFSQ